MLLLTSEIIKAYQWSSVHNNQKATSKRKWQERFGEGQLQEHDQHPKSLIHRPNSLAKPFIHSF
jgi:hypothetical protein